MTAYRAPTSFGWLGSCADGVRQGLALRQDDGGVRGVGVNATTPDELKRAVNAGDGVQQADADQRGDDPASGSESGRIGTSSRASSTRRSRRNQRPRLPRLADFGSHRNVQEKVDHDQGADGRSHPRFSHVQSDRPQQLLAWFGADVIKVERPASATYARPAAGHSNVDSLYFTMLTTTSARSHSTPRIEGQGSPDRLIKTCDVLVENFGPGARAHGFPWEKINSINRR